VQFLGELILWVETARSLDSILKWWWSSRILKTVDFFLGLRNVNSSS
jgi:hypothetical protein